jgi:hypothetical protein
MKTAMPPRVSFRGRKLLGGIENRLALYLKTQTV